MTTEREEMERWEPRLRNAPMRPRAWRELLEREDVAHIQDDAGTLVLHMRDGQLNLDYAFAELEEMRRAFVPLFDELKPEIESFDADYLRIDLVQIPDRTWIEPLLEEAVFSPFGEWMEMVHQDLDPDAPPPDFPDGVTMRRGGVEDFDRIVEIEAEACGELADGEAATGERLAAAVWVGVLERDGEIVGYAANGAVDRAEGRVLSTAVDPDAQGEGFGALLLSAATYQLTASEARRATVRVRPEIPRALRTARSVGFRPDVSGVEWRRPVDEQLIAEQQQRKRLAGVKARFGDWR